LVTSCFPKHAIEGKIEVTGEEEEDLSSYWMTLRKASSPQCASSFNIEYTLKEEARSGEVALEGAMDLS
jgi:hypothetical protein